jgi:hypothetical protein
VLLMRVLDPAETEFSFNEPAMFFDVESGRDLYVDPNAVRSEYLRKFLDHASDVRRVCQELGVEYFHGLTNRPLELALFDFLRARLHSGRQGARTGRRTVRRYA